MSDTQERIEEGFRERIATLERELAEARTRVRELESVVDLGKDALREDRDRIAAQLKAVVDVIHEQGWALNNTDPDDCVRQVLQIAVTNKDNAEMLEAEANHLAAQVERLRGTLRWADEQLPSASMCNYWGSDEQKKREEVSAALADAPAAENGSPPSKSDDQRRDDDLCHCEEDWTDGTAYCGQCHLERKPLPDEDAPTARREAERELFDEVAGGTPEFEDSRVSYVSVQIDRELWLQVKALAGMEVKG